MSSYDYAINQMKNITEKLVEKTVEKTRETLKEHLNIGLRAIKTLYNGFLDAIQRMLEEHKANRENLSAEYLKKINSVLDCRTINYLNVQKNHCRPILSDDIPAEQLENDISSMLESIQQDVEIGLDQFFDPELLDSLSELKRIDVYKLDGKKKKEAVQKFIKVKDQIMLMEEQGLALVHAIRQEKYDPDNDDETVMTAEDIQETVRTISSLISEFESAHCCRHRFSDESEAPICDIEPTLIFRNDQERLENEIRKKERIGG